MKQELPKDKREMNDMTRVLVDLALVTLQRAIKASTAYSISDHARHLLSESVRHLHLALGDLHAAPRPELARTAALVSYSSHDEVIITTAVDESRCMEQLFNADSGRDTDDYDREEHDGFVKVTARLKT